MDIVGDPVARTVLLACALAACSPGAPANVIELEIPEKRTSEFRQGGQRVESIPVVAGQEYLFRVTNGSFDHNFYIGVAEDLAARQYDRLVGIPLWTNATKEVRYTFNEGDQLQFACTLAGHYGPMHGDFVVGVAASAH